MGTNNRQSPISISHKRLGSSNSILQFSKSRSKCKEKRCTTEPEPESESDQMPLESEINTMLQGMEDRRKGVIPEFKKKFQQMRIRR